MRGRWFWRVPESFGHPSSHLALAGLSQASQKDTSIRSGHLLVPTLCQALARGVPGLPGEQAPTFSRWEEEGAQACFRSVP